MLSAESVLSSTTSTRKQAKGAAGASPAGGVTTAGGSPSMGKRRVNSLPWPGPRARGRDPAPVQLNELLHQGQADA